MNDSKYILMLLLSYVVNYPIILSFGLSLLKPIVLLIDDTFNLFSFTKLFHFQPVLLDYTDGVIAVKKKLNRCNSQAVIFPVDRKTLRNNKGKAITELLISQSKTGCNYVPIFLVKGEIPDEIRDDVFEISFPEYLPQCVTNIRADYEMIPYPTELSLVKDEIRKRTESMNAPGFIIPAALLYPYFQRNNLDIDPLFRNALKINRYDEERKQVDAIPDLFLMYLYEWQKKNEFSSVCFLKKLSEESIRQIESTVFIDDKEQVVYIPEKLFQQITSDISEWFNLNSIKKSLTDADILVRGENERYSCHMTYFDEGGGIQRKRMLKFNSNALNRPGEIPFVDKCVISASKEAMV